MHLCAERLKCNLLCADVLAGRKTTGTLTGEVLYAGKPVTTTFLRRYTGYVEQFGKQLMSTHWFKYIS